MTKKYFHPQELSAVRNNCDWRSLVVGLGITRDDSKSNSHEWFCHSPFSADKTASFHISDPGIWYCWSTHTQAPNRKKAGGGVIELVQCVMATRGQIMMLNEATNWLLDNGYSSLYEAVEIPAPDIAPVQVSDSNNDADDELLANEPITTDLYPRLQYHDDFAKRGISESTCHYLKCGFLDGARGKLAKRLVFQINSVIHNKRGELERVILSHMGRMSSESKSHYFCKKANKQVKNSKWHIYYGFNKKIELYNVDNLLLDPEAIAQAKQSQKLIIVEGAFDCAKLIEAGIKNVVASYGAVLCPAQAEKIKWLVNYLQIPLVQIWFDRDDAGIKGATQACDLLHQYGIASTSFDWQQEFTSSTRGAITIPEHIKDPCDMTIEQIRWVVG